MFPKGPKSKQSNDRLLLGFQTHQAYINFACPNINSFKLSTYPLLSGSKAVTEMYQRRDFSLNDTWEALFDRRLGQRVEVMVRIPSNAPVGKEMFRAMFGLLAVLIYLVRR